MSSLSDSWCLQEALSRALPHAIECGCCYTAQVALGYDKLYEAQNPFDWMELISLQVLTLSLCWSCVCIWYLPAFTCQMHLAAGATQQAQQAQGCSPTTSNVT